MFNLEQLAILRRAEIEALLPLFPPGARVLEVGAGAGEQARLLAAAGHAVTAIDVPQSNYANERVFPVIDYDGRAIPFPDGSFDVVFSSNVLEHVTDLDALLPEFRRVLAPGGRQIHLMPSTAWRFWTSLTAFGDVAEAMARFVRALATPGAGYARRLGGAGYTVLGRSYAAIRQPRHGERGNAFSELWLFSAGSWRKLFEKHRFRISRMEPSGLFYTGHMTLGAWLPIGARARLARLLGSACNLFVLENDGSA